VLNLYEKVWRAGEDEQTGGIPMNLKVVGMRENRFSIVS